MPLVPRPGIEKAPLYIPGSHHVEGVAEPAILSANENPLGPGQAAIDAYHGAADALFRYPEGGAVDLRAAIGKRFGLNPDQITCGAGSDEIITMLTRIFAGPGDEVLYSEHGFLMYPINALQVGATPVKAPESNLTTDVDALLAAVTDKTKIVFVANPNNPTGSYIPSAELKRLVEGLPDNVLLVIDAAYSEYVCKNDYNDGVELVDKYQNVVMTRTFSKIFGLAALRLGWVYAPPKITELLNRTRGPFNVGVPAQIAGAAAIADLSHTDKSISHNDKWLSFMTTEFENLGIQVPPSVGNFLIAGFGDKDTADRAYNHLRSNGVIARQMGGYGLADYVRITVGLEKEVRLCVDIMKEFKG
ncbi:histidinol-phosphate transaminase [Aestuariispira insulae]|uniref:Histidinol-phosphate aminotransferase n=1 Tax=Aestuariispira insulae TaxID=1461337 RepID=A0A3D9HQ22_9PROT|nr:histidinol-phosphate transaminase [Aestuariispira insulae]RED51570.1 histidinol-phosphate aminotransferase [Aestuariispira insulae]